METIRIAQLEDCAAIAHVHVESWRTTYRDIVPLKDHPSYGDRISMWQRILSTPSKEKAALVAINEQEQIVGFVYGGKTRHSDLPYETELYAIYLLEEVQGHGIGRRLVQAFAEQLLQMQYQSMIVWAFAQNPACHFYEALGGIRIKTSQLPIGETSYEEVAYGWPDIHGLLL
jgi:L-amino acid N-acyltransferase YncA